MLGAESGETEAFACLSGERGGRHLTELAACFTHSLTRERLSESPTAAPGLGRGPTRCPGAEPPPSGLTALGRTGWLLSESEEGGQEPADQRPEWGKDPTLPSAVWTVSAHPTLHGTAGASKTFREGAVNSQRGQRAGN